MKNKNRGILCVSLAAGLFILAGCSIGPVTAAGTAMVAATRTKEPTRTETLPPTVTPTPTEIPTVLPMVTPSPGPKPELEIVNIAIENDSVTQFMFMGEMRNNTSEPMIFNDREVGLKLKFEQWWKWGDFYRGFIEVNLRPQNSFFQSMNCFLFPGEIGIIAFSTWGICPNDKECPRSKEVIEEFQSRQGTQLVEYQANYRRWKDLKQQYPFNRDYYGYPEELENYNHPKAEKLTYRIDGEQIIIEFDLDILLTPYGSHDSLSWMILYDSANRIKNILYSRPILCEGVGCFISKKYHLFGVGSNVRVLREQTITASPFTDWWRPMIKLTKDQLRQVDHIRVLNEIQIESMCSRTLE